MAKKAKKKEKRDIVRNLPPNMLPQNILSIGERVEEDKNIYISQSVYKQIHKFTKNKTTDESGGMLIGTIIEEFGKTNVVISGFVEAKFCEATPTTLKFTHETWEYVHKEIEKKHKGKKIVGWIHTHPDFGIFLSEYDKFIHQNFFNEVHQVAYVIDPIQRLEGFYFWINGTIERCKGFYIYEKTGTQITVGSGNAGGGAGANGASSEGFKALLIAMLSVAVVFLIFANISTNKKLDRMEAEQAYVAVQQQEFINQMFFQIQQWINEQAVDIQQVEEVLIGAGLMEDPEILVDPAADSTEIKEGEVSADE